jgi:hypothetical protein
MHAFDADARPLCYQVTDPTADIAAPSIPGGIHIL